VLKNKKNIFKFLVLALAISSLLGLTQMASAQIDVGVDEINNSINLGSTDPRTVAARVINVALLVLGIIAVGIIIWGGFVWMTSNGEEDKVSQAKKILKNGIIGLVIVLSAWGIASFILSRLISATGGGGGGGGTCTTGQKLDCGCGGHMKCIDSSWGPCLGSDCGGGGGPISGELGDSCDLNPETPSCEINNSYCAEYLTCGSDSCVCEGVPVIFSISPEGGFCEEDQNKSCLSDDDCTLSCNITTPNGTVDNFVTIRGTNFGVYASSTSKVVFSGDVGGDVAGIMPSEINPECINSWTNNQIIIALPAGIITGPITVIRADNETDVTDDDIGPIIPDFVVNTIARPGLCLLTPDAGLLSQQVNYYGINLYDGQAFFGNYTTNVAGLNSDFISQEGIIGTTTVPNLQAGKMSSFVLASISGNKEKSNYIDFVKEEEAETGPYIAYFEPTTGRAGQYVTIYGDGFGGAQGLSKVFFGEVEANYDFPDVCVDSVWLDQQIIVKVPTNIDDGAFEIKIELNGEEINSQNSRPNAFEVNADESLKTSICKMSPTRGQIGIPVSIWGEYFGVVGENASVKFTDDKNISTLITEDPNDQSAQLLKPNVPDGAVTGAVKVIKDGEGGNGVNFEIGTCVVDSDCGTDVCCPVGTYKQGRCESTLASCYINIPNSVFEWSFITDYSNGTTTPPYDSCQGMAQTLGACQTDSFCPNSPGLCSSRATTTTDIGLCDSSCDSINGCSSSTCTFDSDLDSCVLTDAICSPDSAFTYNLNGLEIKTNKVCKKFSQYGNQNHFEIKTSSSCPDDWTRLSGGHCVDNISITESTCSLCTADFNCHAEDNAEEGICISEELCSGAANCNENSNKCISTEAARCDCCCEIGEDARDCCEPLICDGTCGSDVTPDDDGFGQCSGCYISATSTPSVRDDACNCADHSGKYCDTSVPTGVCVDCGLLSVDACLEHSYACCLDSKGTATSTDDVCIGGTAIATSTDIGYCARYNCDATNNCASSSPVKLGLFKDIDTCVRDCPKSCSDYSDLDSCKAVGGCCFDSKAGICMSGTAISNDTAATTTDIGYCAYYNCMTDENGCNGTASSTGKYSTYFECDIACSLNGLGKDCRSFDITEGADCDLGSCSQPFSCLNSLGDHGKTGDCGVCCCDVTATSSCSGIGNGDLVCQADQNPCSGDSRGLCCGCSQDDNCGNAATLGCDSNTCCRARPSILTDDLIEVAVPE
jgi:hypothetical protein